MDETLKNIRVSEIKAGRRHRKDMGDLKSLAASIREVGLLQPIGITENMKLVFGERRLRAIRDVLKRKTILARIVETLTDVPVEAACLRAAWACARSKKGDSRREQSPNKATVRKIRCCRDPGRRCL